ncbi:MAG: tRNA (adenosine(37)-N6)-threonylcarbamoyltransferase complex dimerization subunit type 1 TsaB [Nitrospinota bacterium]
MDLKIDSLQDGEIVSLGIDASCSPPSVALQVGNRPIKRLSMDSLARRGIDLLKLVERLLSDEKIDKSNIDLIVVATGPGSFTGIRIGIATAVGLSDSLSLKLIGIPTFESILRASKSLFDYETPIAILSDSRKDEYYIGKYIFNRNANLEKLKLDSIVSKDLLERELKDSKIITGSKNILELVQKTSPELGVKLIPIEIQKYIAIGLVIGAKDIYKEGKENGKRVVPNYVARSQAEVKMGINYELT